MIKRSRVGLSVAAAIGTALFLGTTTLAAPPAQARAITHYLDIPAQDLGAALKALGAAADEQVLFSDDVVAGRHSIGVRGEYTTDAALSILLKDTGLRADRTPSGVLLIRHAPSAPATSSLAVTSGSFRLAQAEPQNVSPTPSASAAPSSEPKSSTPLEEFEPQTYGVPEILVKGSRSLNVDIQRSRDEVQPYVVFDRETLARSGATNLETFFRNRLSANATSYLQSQSATSSTRSSINLRGLGPGQTLILVDGRRVGGAVRNGSPQQPDFNSIPLAAIERIEILPATASGIYGGGATGGVVNIVLRHDYRGAEVHLSYDNSFDTDSSIRRADLLAGFALEDGKTHVNLAASHADGNPLTAGDRDFMARSRAERLANNPTAFLSLPPIGATPNIRSVNGSPLFGAGTPNITSVPAGYAGGGGLAPLRANAGSYNLDLVDTTQLDGGARQSLISAPKTQSISFTVRREFTPRIEAFIDAGRSTNEGTYYYDISTQQSASQRFVVAATAPTNPFGQAVIVEFPNRLVGEDDAHSADTESRAVAGVLFGLPAKWRGSLDYTWDRTRSQYTGPSRIDLAAVNAAFANGTLDPFRDTILYPLDLSPYSLGPQLSESNTISTFKNATMRLSGPVLSLPGGNIVVSTLLEHRDENFGAGQSVAATVKFFQPDRSQSIESAYLEVTTPIVSELNARTGVQSLELQLAGRYDKYVLRGARSESTLTPTNPIVRTRSEATSVNPTVGLKYQPLQDVFFRVSYGTGFAPPAINQLATNAPVAIATGFTDPLRGNQTTGVPNLYMGGNPDLTPEESKSRAAGLVFTPRWVQGLRLSVDYVWIHKTDNIATHPLGAQGIINDAALFPGRVVRDTNPATFGSFGVGPILSVDNTLLNIAEAKFEAADVQLDYQLPTASFGTFGFSLMGTRQVHAQSRLIESRPLVENVGVTFNNPPKYKANSSLTWSLRGWSAGWTSRYVDAYQVSTTAATILNQGGLMVAPQTYHDVSASYSFDHDARLLSDLEVRLGVTNVFNKEPPYDAFFSGGFYYSPYGDPRLRTYNISLRKSF